MIKILVVDDHAVVRIGIRDFLATVVDFDVVAEAATGAEALSIIESTELDVVLLDISLPDISGLEVLRRVKQGHSNLPVLLFSSYPEEELATHAYDLGVSGYLNKAGPPQEVVVAIKKVTNGMRYLSPGFTEKLLSETTAALRECHHAVLSRREMEVLLLLSNGVTLTKIADQLDLSVKTIGTYRSRILEKLEMRSNAELTRYVMENKLG
jgi:two-component system invasion response regulator UvrY